MINETEKIQTNDSLIMDWDRLLFFTDGDPEEEEMILELFKSCAEDSIKVLKESLENENCDEWKQAAHKFKGAAANLGAQLLMEACLRAEHAHSEPKDRKEVLMEYILKNYIALQKALGKKQYI